MKALWTFIDGKNGTASAKAAAIVCAASAAAGLIGLLCWCIIRQWCFSGAEWMFCFIGYPVVAAWIAVFFYGCRHELHDGAHI